MKQDKTEKLSKRESKIKFAIIFFSISAVALGSLVFLIPYNNMKKGTRLISQGQYQKAIDVLGNNYLNSAKKQKLLAEAGLYFENNDANKGVKKVVEAGGSVDITYYPNGGEPTKTHEVITNTGIRNLTTRTGYKFKNWDITAFNFTSNNFYIYLNLFANWNPLDYEVYISAMSEYDKSETHIKTFTFDQEYKIDIPRFFGHSLKGFSFYSNSEQIDVPIEGVWTYDTNNIYALWDDYYVEYGSYPQTHVTNQVTINNLNTYVTNLPTSTNFYDWTGYNYHNDTTRDEYAWYKDVTYMGKKYRAFYYTLLRTNFNNDFGTMGFLKDSKGFSYEANTVYWFEFEPIEWIILNETDGSTFMVTKQLIDVQDFFNNNHDLSIKSNNYEHSYVRQWLNNDFYNFAFNENEKNLIKLSNVDNSLESTGNYGGDDICPDTQDKIFLLSGKECEDYFKNCSHYYSGGLGTDYTYSQGLFYHEAWGSSYYLSRSPQCNNLSNGLCTIDYTNRIDYLSIYSLWAMGTRPAMWINTIYDY